jgi:outer membrane protein assembly factor BamC
MKNRIGIVFLIITSAVLAGCSYLQSYFPDKERDYQYTTEIPMINYPVELRKNQNPNSPSDTLSQPENAAENSGQTETGAASSEAPPLAESGSSSAEASTGADAASPDAPSTTPVITSESDDRETVESIEIVKYDDGESRLRLGAGFSKSWRVVNKALSRNSIEVTERNHSKALIIIRYDPDEKKVTDESWTDEINFMFHGINSNDQEYQLKLEEHDQKTDVIVLNEEHLPLLNSAPALRLLKVLADTTKADLAKKVSE